MPKDKVIQDIRNELSPMLKKLGVVLRLGNLVYIRPSLQLGWQAFPKEDQAVLYGWLTSKGYTNIGGKPFLPNDSVLGGSFYFKIN